MSSTTTHTRWGATIGIALGAAAAVALVLMAFIWPTITSSVKSIPIAIAGSSAQVSAVTDALETSASGVFAVTPVSDRQAAVDLIQTRDAYGAIALGAPGAPSPEILTASANGAAVSQILDQLSTPIQAQADAAAQAAVAQAIASGAAPAGTRPPATQSP